MKRVKSRTGRELKSSASFSKIMSIAHYKRESLRKELNTFTFIGNSSNKDSDELT